MFYSRNSVTRVVRILFFSMDWIIVAQKLIKEINTENWNKIISWLVNKRALIDMINQIWMEFLKNEFIFCQNINVWLDMELKFLGIISLYINVTSFSSIPYCSNSDYLPQEVFTLHQMEIKGVALCDKRTSSNSKFETLRDINAVMQFWTFSDPLSSLSR